MTELGIVTLPIMGMAVLFTVALGMFVVGTMRATVELVKVRIKKDPTETKK